MASNQQKLFDTEPAPWEIDDSEQALIAQVVLSAGLETELDYLVPSRLAGRVQAGSRVQVPLGRGNRSVVGYCVGVATKRVGARKLKAVASLLDDRPLISPEMLDVTRWIADYYLCSWAQVLRTVIPSGVRAQAGTRKALLLSLSDGARARRDDLDLPEKQAAILQTLLAHGRPLTPHALAEQAGCTQAPINALRKKGLVVARTERISTYEHQEAAVTREAMLALNADQQTALGAILSALHARRQQTILIHGVTGSGKTEVYLQAIEEVISFGRQAIVLVPEISLTPQTRQRFRRRFDRVAVLHSHLSDAERAWHWNEIVAGKVQVVVGARSAIFAPTPHLGVVVIDEEHENSFKQDKAPRYHARDVALRRARMEQIPLVLGSATPSLESWTKARAGEYRLVEMPRRVLKRPMPDVVTVDLRGELLDKKSSGAISRRLHRATETALAAGEQVILLLNRRGFSTHIQCPACAEVVRCPHCDIALTHHRQDETAVCHYCEYTVPPPTACPECGSSSIRYFGRGTQKLEAEVASRFPKARCLRMDTDSMRKPGSHEAALDAFREGKVDILLGTQMIAKGLDFPNVTLVGVINADLALHLPDFRAAERTFQLVTQVAGRTGRGEKGGRVLVQTYDPDHYAIQAAVRHDYARFAASEIPTRQEGGYPPFTSMIRLVVRGPVQDVVRGFADHVADEIRKRIPPDEKSARIQGPAPAPLAKLRGEYRFQIQAVARDADMLHAAVRAATADLRPPENVAWMADVDPVEMM